MKMSRLPFASVFKLLNTEFGTHSKDDGEAVLESLNREKKVEEETTDHVPQPNFKHKYTDTGSDNDECEQLDELKQSLPNSEELVLDSFTSEKVTGNFVLSNIGEFPDLNENDLSAADIAETTLKKLLDDVEKTSEHRQDQKKKKKKLLTEVKRLKRGRDNHSILNGCSPFSSNSRKGCTKNCAETISNKRRNQIQEYYWSLTKDNQNIWISHMVETITSVRPRKKSTRKKERRFTRTYHLENDKGQKVRACQKMFLSIIGLTTDKTTGTVLSKSGGSRTNDISDKRGKAEPANKKNGETSDLVNHHILGYNTSISHYRRSHAPNRLYISPGHNILAMFKDFCSRYEDIKISYAYYYKKVKKMNIRFVKLGEEECERCDLHDKHLEDISTN